MVDITDHDIYTGPPTKKHISYQTLFSEDTYFLNACVTCSVIPSIIITIKKVKLILAHPACKKNISYSNVIVFDINLWCWVRIIVVEIVANGGIVVLLEIRVRVVESVVQHEDPDPGPGDPALPGLLHVEGDVG